MTTVVVGQTAPTSVELGVAAGAAFSKPSGKDATDFTKTYTGVALGGFVRVGVSRHFAIQPEVQFVQKGGKQPQSGGTTNVKLSYVEVPVLAVVRFPQASGGQLIPHLYAGPALAFKAGCSLGGSGTGKPPSSNCADEGLKVKSTDFSLVFGGGIDVGRAVIDLRYDLGLTKPDDSSPPQDAKNRTFSVLVGWRFGLAR
jgi:hypothetical protein